MKDQADAPSVAMPVDDGYCEAVVRSFRGTTLTLDAEGDRTALDETALSGQLFGGLTSSETFGYDAATNITARTGPAATYTMDGANRVTGDGTRAFTWDGADRLTRRGADTFGYDALGRMTGSTIGSPVPVTRSYAYDGDGLLRSRTTAGLTTSFLWDASTAPAPLLAAGSDRVVHGLAPLYLARANGSTLTFVRDALGSVRAEVTDAGVIAKAFRYAAYGEIVQPNANTPTLLGFTGELRDPSGLIYLRARWYDPVVGRFVQRDTFHGSVSRPTSLNSFGYARGSPLAWTDPLGLDPTKADVRRALASLALNAIDFVLFGPGSTVHETSEGILIARNANFGILGALTNVLGLGAGAAFGTNTATYSASLIVSTTEPSKRLVEHEMGHIEQARELGALYLPAYAGGVFMVPGVWLAANLTGHPLTLHDAHLMERNANVRRGLGDPWRDR